MANRKQILLGVLILSLFILCSCSSAKNTPVGNTQIDSKSILSKAFPVGDHSVSIMEISLPSELVPRLEDINTRFKNSVQKNQEWFNDYISKHANSEDGLPWDEKFGITREEYDEIISSVEKMRMTEKTKTTISIVKENDGKLTLKSNQELPYLSEIKIDIENNCILNDLGTFEYSSTFEASSDQKVTGPWSGNTWKLNFEELSDIGSIDRNKTYGTISISVGQLEQTGQMIVYYKERIIHQGENYKGEEIIVFNN